MSLNVGPGSAEWSTLCLKHCTVLTSLNLHLCFYPNANESLLFLESSNVLDGIRSLSGSQSLRRVSLILTFIDAGLHEACSAVDNRIDWGRMVQVLSRSVFANLQAVSFHFSQFLEFEVVTFFQPIVAHRLNSLYDQGMLSFLPAMSSMPSECRQL